MADWIDKMMGRIREAPTMDSARLAVKDYLDPATGEKREGVDGDNDTHIHLHMNGKGGEGGGAMDDDPGLDPGANGEPDPGDLAAQVAELTQRVDQLEAMMSDEEDVELEGENEDGTKDARRFKLRRGTKLSTRDEDIPVPERREDIIGETDLPGTEDLDKRMPTATADQKRRARSNMLRTRDSADQEDLWTETVAAAEIIVPGFKVPTFDARLPMIRTAERLCAIRRRVLTEAFKDDTASAVIADVVGIKTADALKPLACDTVKMAFHAAANAMRSHNTAGATRTAVGTARTGDNTGKKGPPSIAEMNKQAREMWSREKTNGAARR